MPLTLSATHPKARKPHRCDYCSGTIQPGTTYHRSYLIGDDGPYSWRHPVPPKRRSKAPRPWNLKPPKCPTCRNLLHPAFDHSKCGIGKDKP
jgi:hypothetical protein